MIQARTRVSPLAVLALLLVIACTAGRAQHPALAAQQSGATPSTSISAGAATLGGTEAAFTDKFGQPEPRYIYAFRTKTAERVILYLGLLHLTTGQIRVRTIIVQRLVQDGWDNATARSIYQPFFPPDAQSQGQLASGFGVHHLFKSGLLANTFPPGAFVDAYGKQLAPGTFDVVCNSKLISGTDGSYGCGLTIGEWPLN